MIPKYNLFDKKKNILIWLTKPLRKEQFIDYNFNYVSTNGKLSVNLFNSGIYFSCFLAHFLYLSPLAFSCMYTHSLYCNKNSIVCFNEKPINSRHRIIISGSVFLFSMFHFFFLFISILFHSLTQSRWRNHKNFLFSHIQCVFLT